MARCAFATRVQAALRSYHLRLPRSSVWICLMRGLVRRRLARFFHLLRKVCLRLRGGWLLVCGMLRKESFCWLYIICRLMVCPGVFFLKSLRFFVRERRCRLWVMVYKTGWGILRPRLPGPSVLGNLSTGRIRPERNIVYLWTVLCWRQRIRLGMQRTITMFWMRSTPDWFLRRPRFIERRSMIY